MQSCEHHALPTHNGPTGNTPAKIYNNTLLIEENPNAEGAALERQGAKTAGRHSVFNNIVLQYSDREYLRGVTVGATDQELDYNIMFKPNGGSFQLFNSWPNGSGGLTNYSSLAAWRASAGFTESQSVYTPGFEANSIQGDPQLLDVDNADYRPNAAGIAASGAKPLASTGWPGATNDSYFGAVSPSATNGLGDVGARGQPGP